MAAFSLGILCFLGIYGMEPLRVSGLGWILQGFGGDDLLQHQTGWMFFRASPWGFPLGKASLLGAPEGTPISFTDSLPLVSLFFKLLDPWLPEAFQFIGVYTALCFGLTALFAECLLERFTRSPRFSLIGSLLFVFFSGTLERAFRHTALSSHWLFLASLLLVFAESGPHFFWETLLSCIALGIHPYLFACVFPLTLLPEVRWARGNGAWLRFCGRLFSALLLCLGFGALLGVFGGGVEPAPGYGTYSLNLNALWNPATDLTEHWSRFLPPQPRTDAQRDGSFYFGLFPLSAFALCLIFRFGAFRRALRQWFELSLCLGLFTLFALSHVWTFNTATLMRLPLPSGVLRLLDVFRSGSRFFYPVCEVMLLWTAVTLFRWLKDGWREAVLILLIGLHLADIAPGLRALHGHFAVRLPLPEYSPVWDHAAGYSRLMTFENLTHRPLAFWAAQNGMETNLMISAPIHLNAYFADTHEERAAFYESLLAGDPLEPDTLVVFSTETGTNRILETPEALDALLDAVRRNYRDSADLEFVSDETHNYWFLMPKGR